MFFRYLGNTNSVAVTYAVKQVLIYALLRGQHKTFFRYLGYIMFAVVP